jgi:spermidine synthase
MQRYGGELIYHGRDEDGALEVVDAYGIRALHFGSWPKQSALSLANPERLELPYIRAMLSPLLFIDNPQRVLVIGLGGGSLTRFLLEQFPSCEIDAIERRAGVVEIAHTYFGLPRSERLRVQVADGCEHVELLSQQTSQIYDLLLVDAYDHQGMDFSINTPEFFEACSRLLQPLGVVALNLWGSHPVAFKRSCTLLNNYFAERAFRLAVPNRGNVIGLGLGEHTLPSSLKQLQPKARDLEFRTGLEMPYFLRNLRPV